jgi:hypothetical protein
VAHVRLVVAPTTLENVFTEQFRHTDVPITALYLPVTHITHGPPFGPLAPALQVHVVIAELPTGELEASGQLRHVSEVFAPSVQEYVPSEQSVHTAVPFATLYLPTAHRTHGPPFGPVDPASQMQFAMDTDPSNEDDRAGHVVQALDPAAAYVPARHEAHTLEFVAPDTLENVPAGQLLHCPLAQNLPRSHRLHLEEA